MTLVTSSAVRAHLVRALEAELVGPYAEHEDRFPTNVALVTLDAIGSQLYGPKTRHALFLDEHRPMSAAEAAEVVTAEISEPLTWAEICARYPDESVWLVEVSKLEILGLAVPSFPVQGLTTTKPRGKRAKKASSNQLSLLDDES